MAAVEDLRARENFGDVFRGGKRIYDGHVFWPLELRTPRTPLAHDLGHRRRRLAFGSPGRPAVTEQPLRPKPSVIVASDTETGPRNDIHRFRYEW